MGMFHDLMNKVFGHAQSGGAPAAPAASTPAAPTPGTASTPGTAPSSVADPGTASAGTTSGQKSAPAPAVPGTVDIAAVLDDMAARNPEKLDWKRSIVDLLKLVGMDSSLTARKKLAEELHYAGDTSDSAQMNTWLHKEVLKQLAQNGGKLPPGLLDY